MMAVSPLREQEEQLRLLTLHLRSGRGGLLIVVTPDAKAERTLAEELRLRIKDAVKVEAVTFTAALVERLSLSHHLSTLPEPSGKAAVSVFGLDDLPLDARTTAINAMNWGRERLRWSGYTVVLWVRPGTPGELGNRAPDFFSWRSDVFEFDLPADPVERQRRLAELRLFAPATLDELRERYGDYVLRTCQWLDFRGLLQVRNVVRLPLDEVFIPLQATTTLNYVPPPPSSQASDVDNTDYSARECYHAAPPVALSKVAGQHQRLVVLGDPGSGKSTLLRFLALAFARGKAWAHEHLGINEDRLPILAPLSAFSEARKAHPDLSLAEFLPRYFIGQGLPDFSPLFDDALCNGRGLVLLDGLDEMLTYDDRVDVAQSIADFANAYPTARIVVTSRVAGYAPEMLPADFVTYTLAPFNEDAIMRFARQWSRAFEAIGLPAHTALPPDGEQRAILRAESLVSAVTGHPGVWRLATNPLLLTLLALIHYQGTRLPHRRVDLYRLCVEALAETWNLARSLTGRPIDIYLGERHLDEAFVARILAPIAYWMHETKPAGLVERGELEAHIAEQFVQCEGTSTEEASALAHDFLALVREQMGLLVERAPNTFSFLHLSIQEYLAARFLSERMDGFERLKPRLHHPRWREVVLLTAGCLRGDYASAFVEGILNVHGPFEGLCNRALTIMQERPEKTVILKTLFGLLDLLLAVHCLRDDVPVRPQLRQQVRDTLLYLWRHLPSDLLHYSITHTFSYLRGSVIGSDILGYLLKIVQERDEDTILRWEAIQALAYIGLGEPTVVETLLSIMNDKDEKTDARGGAAQALGHAANGDVRLVEMLLRLVRDQSEDWHVRERVIRTLGQVGDGEAQVIELLLRLAQDRREDREVRKSAVRALGHVENNRAKMVEPLLRLVHARGEDLEVRYSAILALGNAGRGNAQVVETLLRIVGNPDEDEEIRGFGAWALGEAGLDDPHVVEALLNLLQDCREGVWVRGHAAEALGAPSCMKPQVVKTLLSLVRNKKEEKRLRQSAVWALGRVGKGDFRIAKTLLSVMRNKGENEEVRQAAVLALGDVGEWTDTVVRTLLRAAEDPALRDEVLRTLWDLFEAGDGFVPTESNPSQA
jgi:HEAT repeat protein/energy-coupling factor transporter ATP-binding protein EcfA2